MGMRKPKETQKEEAKEAADKMAKEKKVALKRKKALEGIRGIVRIGEVDVEGDKKLRNALLKIKGVGKSLSKAFIIASGLSPDIMIGSLNDEQIKKIEDVMKNPSNYGIPYHMLNRRGDPQTGQNKHLISSELNFAIKSDVDSMKKMRSYKGIRHELGLPCRGQRTRSSFRTGGIVGVVKKKQVPGAAPTAPGAQPATAKVEAKPEAKPETKPEAKTK
jgi:small subunit ribosomal protein S13